LSPLLIPLVLASDWTAASKSIVSGVLAFGLPELLMLLAVAIMGKEGYAYIKSKVSKYLRRFAPPDEVGPLRYRIGLLLLGIPFVFGILQPYLIYNFEFFKSFPLWVHATLDMTLIIAFFVLGGDFWDKFRALFQHRAKICTKKKS
jgi:hypothetical protein